MKGIKLRFAAVCIFACSSAQLYAAPNTEGSWSGVLNWPMVPQHAVLTPEGKVFTWGTDSRGENSSEFNYDLWSPTLGGGGNSHRTLPNTVGVDSFCSGALLLAASGEVIMPGGDAREQGANNAGVKNVLKYNTNGGGLSSAASMNFARWYPTTITLPNADILAVGGRDVAKRNVVTPEVYNPSTNRWRSLFGANTSKYNFWYPRLWVLPNGRVFGIAKGEPGSPGIHMYYMNTAGAGSISDAGKLAFNGGRFTPSTAVMYRPGKILFVITNGDLTRTSAVTIDVTGANPVVRNIAGPNLGTGRAWSNSVILPDGKVMLVGGSGVRNKLEGVSYRPEIWDPSTERWSTMDSHKQARLYHSTALLLKDGRVLLGGGGSPGPQLNLNAEIFSPPYLYSNTSRVAARPRITGAPKQAAHGTRINVAHSSGNPISRVTLVKTGAVTHSFNMDQRFMELGFRDTATGVNVSIPNSVNVATPGHYLMYLIDNKGVPSDGHIIKINKATVTNTALVARPDTARASGNRITIDALANDSGTGLVLSLPSAYSQKGGRVAVVGNKITYTAKPGFNGLDKVFMRVRDSSGTQRWTNVAITVSGNAGAANPFPVGKADTVTATANVARTVDVLANDVGNGKVLVAPNPWSQKGGRVAVVNNKFRYTAKSSFNGLDKIFYSFRDVQGRQAWSVANINVTGGAGVTNPFPVGRADTFNAKSGVRKTLNILANDVGNGKVLNPLSSAYSQKGAAVSIVSNQLSYRSKAGFVGVDKVWYNFKDVQGRRAWSVVTINVSR